jgi:glyoxylase-like metal-dependent hydrolase (beta-lactamase superfamily II)
MTYTGDVVVGGPPQVRELDGVRITKVATPPFDNNCYLVRCTSTGATLLVDAAGDARTLLSLVGDGKLVAVVETHSHWDHVQALAEVPDRRPARGSSRTRPTPATCPCPRTGWSSTATRSASAS